MFHTIELDPKSTPTPLFEITPADVKSAWLHYLTAPEWTKSPSEAKTELQKVRVGKVALVKEKLKLFAEDLKLKGRWVITPYTAEITFLKELNDKDFSLAENKFSFATQLMLIELLYKSTAGKNSPAMRAVKPLKDKIAHSGQWENVAKLILELKRDNLATPITLTAIIQQAQHILPARFHLIKGAIRELHIETQPTVVEIAAIIALPHADKIAIISRELRAADCFHPMVFAALCDHAARIEELANPLSNLRYRPAVQVHLKLTLEIAITAGVTDTLSIFTILKNPEAHTKLPELLILLQEFTVDNADTIHSILQKQTDAAMLIDFINELKTIYSRVNIKSFLGLILEKKAHLWDFIYAIAVLHAIRLDTPKNILAVLQLEKYVLEISDALDMLYGLQVNYKPTTHFCTQALFNSILKFPQYAYKIATVIPALFEAGLAKLENVTVIIQQLAEFSWDIAAVINELHFAGIASQRNFEKICQFADVTAELAAELARLREKQLPITQESFEEALQKCLRQRQEMQAWLTPKTRSFFADKSECLAEEKMQVDYSFNCKGRSSTIA